MGLLRRSKKSDEAVPAEALDQQPDQIVDRQSDRSHGPFDAAEEEIPTGDNKRLNLGSVSIPMPPSGQVQVEMGQGGAVQGVHVATPHGRITVSAYAAPKSSGQWLTVSGELAKSLQTDGATVTTEEGPWGAEVLASTDKADIRFIGVDGPRWMIRLVAAGPAGKASHDGELSVMARDVLRGTIVDRGDSPLPVRTPLPITLPKALHEQLIAMQQQQQAAAARKAAQSGDVQQDPPQQDPPQQNPPQPPIQQ
ncbi:DUF3710 domain-containing protein [Hoyosella rhizosphaerae]|uniref:DUF3710 domain-containing protein n=1 Tax=Hoyosella rhizosphaerae TaxID=1755582 RepID=A0A916U405_9ACTN|nr:DUF3710 domain-containing protein [Hoyosella rhizosphaerae]MBN4926387.1 DUF3710 domain-containing protein [Hoyosella rhizosphaerae]GGC59793.1 hypothetical protein GCM10011410_10270 [Hoyosella rhizosphaerae]